MDYVPPNDLDAEGIVLSAALLETEALDRLEPVLKPEHFYADANRRIYEALLDLAGSGRPTDISAVSGWLRDRERLEQIGGTPYIAQILAATPATTKLEAHARRIIDKWRLRQIITEARAITVEAYAVADDVGSFVQSAEARLYAVAQDLSRAATLRSARDVMTQCLRETTEARRGLKPSGASTGFLSLDKRIGGLKPGRVYVGAGRPGMGKTSFLTQAAKSVATSKSDARGVFIASIEMPSKQIGDRLLAQEAQIDTRCVENGVMTPKQWDDYVNAVAEVSNWPLMLEDFAGISVPEIRSSVRRAVRNFEREHGTRLGLVGIDYLQLMGTTDKVQNENDKLSQISAGVLAIAKEFDVPVVLLSQLNRDCEKRPDKLPSLADLRGSGSIEQDAHTVILFYRHDVYKKSGEVKDRSAEFIVAKARGGRTGIVKLSYLEFCTKFIDEPDDEPGDQYADIYDNFGEPERIP